MNEIPQGWQRSTGGGIYRYHNYYDLTVNEHTDDNGKKYWTFRCVRGWKDCDSGLRDSQELAIKAAMDYANNK
jgi:hypothetical protein